MAKRIAEAEAEAERLADAPLSLAAQLDGLEADSTAAAEAARAAAAHERAAEETLRETEKRLADVGEALSIAREARAGAVARHENQEMRRIEMGRISGERFECPRSEEHTSELQSLMRISYAVLCLKKKKITQR